MGTTHYYLTQHAQNVHQLILFFGPSIDSRIPQNFSTIGLTQVNSMCVR